MDKLLGEDGKWRPREMPKSGESAPEPALALNTVHALDVLVGLKKLEPESVNLVFAGPPYP